MSKKSNKEIDLKDFIWEEEEFKFQPKVNRHKKFLKSKKRQLEKEAYIDANKKNNIDCTFFNEHQRYISKVEESLLQDYYDRDDDKDYEGYRIK